mgnify:CR=1 FL=1
MTPSELFAQEGREGIPARGISPFLVTVRAEDCEGMGRARVYFYGVWRAGGFQLFGERCDIIQRD